jgi:hypothetical protein
LVVLGSKGIVIILLVVLFVWKKQVFVLKKGFVSFIKDINIDIGIIGIVFPVNGEVIGILILLL